MCVSTIRQKVGARSWPDRFISAFGLHQHSSDVIPQVQLTVENWIRGFDSCSILFKFILYEISVRRVSSYKHARPTQRKRACYVFLQSHSEKSLHKFSLESQPSTNERQVLLGSHQAIRTIDMINMEISSQLVQVDFDQTTERIKYCSIRVASPARPRHCDFPCSNSSQLCAVCWLRGCRNLELYFIIYFPQH